MRWVWPAAAAVTAVLVGGLAIAAIGGHEGRSPAPPIRNLAAIGPRLTGVAQVSFDRANGCDYTLPTAAGDGRRGLVFVDRNPVRVAAIWTPTIQMPCRVVFTSDDSTVATRLASAIDAAPRFPDGPISCPAAFGGEIQLDFQFPHRAGEEVQVNLTGCVALSAPDRHARWMSGSAWRDLRTITPTAWRRILSP